jgi:hypothetical protein
MFPPAAFSFSQIFISFRIRSMMVTVIASLVLNLASSGHSQDTNQAEPVFSGPQVGESVSPFSVTGVFDEQAGVRFDPVSQAGEKPLLLLFVHQANRPSIAMTRVLMNYVRDREKKDVESCVVWLTSDPTQAENDLKRMRHALPEKTMTGIYSDGIEGPGSYGLNRQMTLTILLCHRGKVVANYALIQPSLQVDLPQIVKSIVDLAGGEMPDIKQLQDSQMRGRDSRPMANGNADSQIVEQLRPRVRPLIQLDASEQQVDKAAEDIEKWIADKPAAKKEIGRIARTIVGSGKLENYGTPRAQAILRQWAKTYGEMKEEPEKR